MRHLTEADILLFLNDDLHDEQRIKYEKHLADCDNCSEKLADIYRLEERLKSSDPPEVDTESLEKAKKLVGNKENGNHFLLNLRHFSAAAIFLLAAFLAVWLWTGPEYSGQQEEFRSGSESPVVQPLQPGDGASLPNNNAELSWEPVVNSASYRLIIYAESGVEIWSTQIDSTKKNLPGNISLEPETRYLWKVEAIMPDGTVISSPLQSFYLEK